MQLPGQLVSRLLTTIFTIFLSSFFFVPGYAGQTFNPFTQTPDKCVTVEEIDGSPSNAQCKKIKVSNGALTDNGDGTFTMTTGVGGGGDVSGGSTSVDREIAVYSGTGGKTLQAGTSNQPTVSAAGVLSVPGGVNKVTITAPATGSTLTIANGKTLTVTNTANINTLTDANICKYSTSGTAIDCNVPQDGSGVCAAGSVCTGGHTHTASEVSDATATPTASKIPIADGSGKVDGWTTLGASIDDAEIPDSVTVTGWALGASAATTASADDNDTSVSTTAFVQQEINGSGGRSITCSSGSCDADSEAYQYRWRYGSFDPVATDDISQVDYFYKATTLLEFRCYSDQTVVVNLQRDDGSAANIFTADVTCDSNGGSACASGCDTTLVADEDNAAATNKLNLVTVSVSGTPTKVTMQLFGTLDD